MYEWVLFVASAYLIVVGAVALGLYDPGALAVLVSIPLAVRTARIVFNEVGTALNRALAMTGQLALAFGALFSAGVIVGGSLF
jgi:1,4-dihydroxy-2-naphthoate octaprenyltransferase